MKPQTIISQLNETKTIIDNCIQQLSELPHGKSKGRPADPTESKKMWYKPGSTVDKFVGLILEKFFNKPKSLNEIVSRLEESNYHLKPSDLTLPLRKVVRNGLLKRTMLLPDGTTSKKWLYVKV